MIIQITNRCHMGCPHYMQDSTPDGKHMTQEVFDCVLDFCRDMQPLVVNVSGGEPLEHPDWLKMVKALLEIKSVQVLTILTNGYWIEDNTQRIAMAKLIRSSKGRVKVQVYSHPKYYKNHEWTVSHEAQFRSIGCIPDFKSPIFMQDLGRARKNCQEEVSESTHVPSCINSHLLAMQTRSLQAFHWATIQAAKFCRPLIDPEGNIHMSESCLCPTVASVFDGMDKAFDKMKRSRPCKGCQLYKNFEQLHPKEMEILNQSKVYYERVH